MSTCDTCKYWTHYTIGAAARGFGKCSNPKIGPDMKGDDWLYVPEGECSYDPTTDTGPKFGCVHHEQKKPEPKRKPSVAPCPNSQNLRHSWKASTWKPDDFCLNCGITVREVTKLTSCKVAL